MQAYTVTDSIKPGIRLAIMEKLDRSGMLEPDPGDDDCVVLAVEQARSASPIAGKVDSFQTYASGGNYGVLLRVRNGAHIEVSMPDHSLRLITVSDHGEVNIVSPLDHAQFVRRARESANVHVTTLPSLDFARPTMTPEPREGSLAPEPVLPVSSGVSLSAFDELSAELKLARAHPRRFK
jgi:hypothetical protein